MKKLFYICILLLLPDLAFGWGVTTHQLISAYACINSKLVQDNFIWKLNFDKGAAQPLTLFFDTKTAAEWIYYGAEKEDEATSFLFRLIRPVIPVNSTTHCNMKGKEKKTRP